MYIRICRLEGGLFNMKLKLNTVLDHITVKNTVGTLYLSKHTSTGEICMDWYIKITNQRVCKKYAMSQTRVKKSMKSLQVESNDKISEGNRFITLTCLKIMLTLYYRLENSGSIPPVSSLAQGWPSQSCHRQSTRVLCPIGQTGTVTKVPQVPGESCCLSGKPENPAGLCLWQDWDGHRRISRQWNWCSPLTLSSIDLFSQNV